jgi:hypothetical protein
MPDHYRVPYSRFITSGLDNEVAATGMKPGSGTRVRDLIRDILRGGED